MWKMHQSTVTSSSWAFRFLEKRLRGNLCQPPIDVRDGRPQIGQQAIRRYGFAPVELLLPDASNRLPTDHLDRPVAAASRQVKQQIANAVRRVVGAKPDLLRVR
jgi:hypothetical protein